MKKEEILKRSRDEKQDEGLDFARSKGRKLGFIGFSAICLVIQAIIFVLNLIVSIDYIPDVVGVIYVTYLCFFLLGQYRATKDWELKGLSIVMLIFTVFMLAMYAIMGLSNAGIIDLSQLREILYNISSDLQS